VPGATRIKVVLPERGKPGPAKPEQAEPEQDEAAEPEEEEEEVDTGGPQPGERGRPRTKGNTMRPRVTLKTKAQKLKKKSASGFNLDVYDETAKIWAKSFASPEEYDACRLTVREFMRNKKYPPKMVERIAEFAAKSYTGEQMETVYPALIRAIDDIGAAFKMTDG
jgi:hypothetical protein